MPQLPIPPPQTITPGQRMTQIINTSAFTSHSFQQAILDAEQIRDIALEQAKKVLDEFMKQEQQKRKTILTIENIDKIVGCDYNDSLRVAGVKELDTHYEFTLIYAHHNTIETILLHRRQTSDKRYIMEYQGQTLWVSKDRLSTIDGILECMREV
jgi:glycerol-3-phosphate O-acyltransferase